MWPEKPSSRRFNLAEMLEETCSDDEGSLLGHGDDTQSCFVLHKASQSGSCAEISPAKTAYYVKRKRTGKQDAYPSSLPPCFPDELQEWGVRRLEAFKRTWMDIEINVKEVFEALNNKIFREIQKFVHDIVFCDAQLELYLSPKSTSISSTGGIARASRQLHTAFLRLRNVDSSDHTKTFGQLKTHLRKGNCHVANLLSSNFSNKGGVSAPLHNMMRQITGISPDTADMDVLAAWYRTKSNVKCPIAIIIEDAELCNSMILADFIVILSEWIAELPLVLIMGMATSGEAIHKLLPGSAARHLHVHNFMFPSPDEYLKGIIEGVLLKPVPLFTMSSDSLAFLLSQYLKYDSTVTSFLRALKMACMEHFISQPLSFLCTNLTSSPIQDLMEPHLHYAAGLPSLQSKQFRTDSDISNEILRAFDKLRAQKGKWNSIVLCLIVTSSLLGLDSVKMFLQILEQKSCKSHPVERITTVNGDSFKQKYHGDQNLLSTLLKKLRDAPEPILSKILTHWVKYSEESEEWTAEAQNILQCLAEQRPQNFRMDGISNGTITSRVKQLLSSIQEERQENTTTNEENSDSHALIQRDEQITANSEADPSHAIGVDEIHPGQKKMGFKVHGKLAANLLEKMMRKDLVPVESLPFHEIICFEKLAAVKQVLVGEPRRVIQQNVERAPKVLKCNCCFLKNVDVSSSMNDSTILFLLAHKQGDHANLCDLYQNFTALVTSSAGMNHANSKKGHRKSPNKVTHHEEDKALIQARFCKAALDLQLVGLFRMAGKKQLDSVQLVV